MIILTIVAAYLGNTQAEYRLGYAYLYGVGITRNNKAAGKSWSHLVLRLSACWDQQNPSYKQYDWYHLIVRKAQLNNRPAQFQLGLLLQYGQAYTLMPQALVWYHRAADGYYPPALLKLGFIYDKGLGVKPDKWRARYYLRLARLDWR